MALSEPWLALGFPEERIWEGLMDPARKVYRAELEGKMAGVLMLVLQGAFTGYIQNIFVHPDFRNRGLGKQLVYFAEEQIFSSRPNIFLCVSDFNHRARKFYASLGYEEIGHLKNYLRTGHSEILMRKSRGALLEWQPPG